MSEKVFVARVVSASDVARLLAKPPEGSEEDRLFGKAFEECFQTAAWLHYSDRVMGPRITKLFIRRLAAELRAMGIYTRERLLDGYRMYSALIRAGVSGRTPRTEYRLAGEGLVISAKPDLVDDLSHKFYEFKTYPIDGFARAQARVFSWVLNSPITLVGLRRVGTRYEAEVEVVSSEDFEIPQIPEGIGAFKEFCPVCIRPALPGVDCNCYEYLFDMYEEE